MAPPILRRYLAAQAVAIGAFFFAPVGGWLHPLWQVTVGWASAVAVVVGVRRSRPPASLAWCALGAGVFLNASGLLVEHIGEQFFGALDSPNLSDVFFLGIFPCFIFGLGALVWRRSAGETLPSVLLNTVLSALLAAALSLVAWEFIVWQTQTDPSLRLAKRLIVTAYPLGDLVLLALMMRLLLARGGRQVAFVLVVLSMCFFLGADIGWAGILRQGVQPGPQTRKLLEMSSMAAFSLVGAAALHPSVERVARVDEAVHPGWAGVRWATLVVSVLTAPAVLATQALLDGWYSLSF